MTKFIAEELSLDQIAAVRPVLARLQRVDRHLADQLRRAVQSVSPNLAEGNGRTGADRANRFRMARASHLEVRNALRQALRFGYVHDAEIADADRLADRLGGMLWSLAK